MKTTVLLVSAMLLAPCGAAFAQTASQTSGSQTTAAPSMGTPSANGPAAASGDNNQAVATTDANAPQPAHGSNSFTRKQAAHRIAKHGYTEVKDLTKDSNGVWHGSAMHDGAAAKVWLDYKGNVGTE